jgi:excisionase family DNA binding protein
MTLAATVPEVLTIDEAAQLLRIGRNNAYALAREWLASDGAHGIPVVRLGRSLRVPRAALQRLLDDTAGTGPAVPSGKASF